MSKTTLKIDSETLRLLKVRKAILDFNNYDDLILYLLKFAPNDYVMSEPGELGKQKKDKIKEEENKVNKLKKKLISELGLKEPKT